MDRHPRDFFKPLAIGAPEPLREIPFKPSRVVMQDFTGVPAVVDLAALRSADWTSASCVTSAASRGSASCAF